MWIAHRSDREFHAPFRQLDVETRPGFALCFEGHGRRCEQRFTHIHRHRTGRTQLRLDEAGGTLQLQVAVGGAATLAQQLGKAAHAIAALFHFTAVRIEDAVVGQRAVVTRWLEHQCLVETDAPETSDSCRHCDAEMGRPSREGASSTMKSLPSPCILVKGSCMVAGYTAAHGPNEPEPLATGAP